MRYGLPAWVVLVTAVAYAVRGALVLGLRHRWPAAAELADRWWPWASVVAVLVTVTIAVWPLGLALTVGLAIALTRSTAIGSPFRPRR